MKVGGAGAALQVEHPHGMAGVILEDIRDGFLLFAVDNNGFHLEDALQPVLKILFQVLFPGVLCSVGCFKALFKGEWRSVFDNFACSEVHVAVQGGVDTAQVKHQDIVHIQPEVVVTGELEDQVVAPGVQSARALHEAG